MPHSIHIVAETSRLILRQLAEADLDFMAGLFGSLDVMRYSLTGPLLRSQAAELLTDVIQSYSAQPLSQWGVATKTDGQLKGLCGFLRRPDNPSGEWELAYRFLPSAWGHGLATEAATACRDVALNTTGVIQISALVEPQHAASIRVAQKVGLQFQSQTNLSGILVLKYVLQPDGVTSRARD